MIIPSPSRTLRSLMTVAASVGSRCTDDYRTTP